MCSPLSGVCPDEKFDTTPYALATARFFLRNQCLKIFHVNSSSLLLVVKNMEWQE
jgi:hypothetical protein